MDSEILTVLNSINENLVNLNYKIDLLRSDISSMDSNTSMNDVYLGSIDGAISSIADSVSSIELHI